MKKVFSTLLFILIASVFSAPGQTGTTAAQKSDAESLNESFAMFGSEAVLNVTIQLDLTSFLKKNLKGASLDASFTIHLNETDTITKKIKIKARGNFRYDNCSFPPMQLSFKKHLHAYSDSDNIKKIKLVTHCSTGGSSDDYVLREYLVYKLFNVISDTCFNVRLLRITYIDTQKKRKPVTQYGFFIEPEDILAERLNTTIVKTMKLTQKHIFPDYMDKVSIFNYMIANWDWNIPNLQNVTLLKPVVSVNEVRGLAVPYDFDLCGIVNASYGVAPEEYGLETSRDRIFLGICRSKAIFRSDLRFFQSKKEELYNTINDFSHLNARAKKDIIMLLDQFYNKLNKEVDIDDLIDYFLSTCKNI